MEKIFFLDLTRGKNAVTVEKEYHRKGVSRHDHPSRPARADLLREPVWLPFLCYVHFWGTRCGVSSFLYGHYFSGPLAGGPDLTPVESSA